MTSQNHKALNEPEINNKHIIYLTVLNALRAQPRINQKGSNSSRILIIIIHHKFSSQILLRSVTTWTLILSDEFYNSKIKKNIVKSR